MDIATKRQFKTELFEQFARIGKALAAPQRLEMLELLSQGEKSVEELAGAIAVPIANASQHLQVLRRAELVSIRCQGTHIYYRLADPTVFRLWQTLRELGETRLAEVDRVVRTYPCGPAGVRPGNRQRRRPHGAVRSPLTTPDGPAPYPKGTQDPRSG